MSQSGGHRRHRHLRAALGSLPAVVAAGQGRDDPSPRAVVHGGHVGPGGAGAGVGIAFVVVGVGRRRGRPGTGRRLCRAEAGRGPARRSARRTVARGESPTAPVKAAGDAGGRPGRRARPSAALREVGQRRVPKPPRAIDDEDRAEPAPRGLRRGRGTESGCGDGHEGDRQPAGPQPGPWPHRPPAAAASLGIGCGWAVSKRSPSLCRRAQGPR